MFKIGDTIAYPMHGVGQVDAIENREVRGEEDTYYVLTFRADGVKVLLPIGRAAEAGLRHVISAEEAEALLAFIADCGVDEPIANWNRRYRFNLDRLKTNDVESIVRVVKSLSARSSEKGLSSGEKSMLANARAFLVDELAVAIGKTVEEMDARLTQILESCSI